MNTKAFLFGAGLARKAGKLTAGTESVLDEVRKHGKHTTVVMACDLSDNSVKKITDSCSYYHAELLLCESTKVELGTAVGKPFAACICVSDSNFSELLKRNLSHNE